MSKPRSYSEFKKLIEVGDTIRVTNHLRPQANRITDVTHVQGNAFCTRAWKEDGTEVVKSWFYWKPASQAKVSEDGRTVAFFEPGSSEPWITYTVLEGAAAEPVTA